MCNCLSETIKKIAEKYPYWPDENGKKVQRFNYSDEGLNFQTGKSIFNIGIDIKFDGQKKLGHTYLKMSHCPLCGEKFEED